jgi:hypothetical protein
MAQRDNIIQHKSKPPDDPSGGSDDKGENTMRIYIIGGVFIIYNSYSE